MFQHLHVHTDISPDGLGNVSRLVETAKDIGFEYLAVTDHGSLGNWVTFFLECTKKDIKPILGVEAYLEYNGEICHITLLAANESGYKNLISVQNDAVERNHKKTIVLSLRDFKNKSEGIFALTGCPSSAIHKGSFGDGKQYVVDLVKTFGKDNVFIEVMFPNDDDNHSRPIAISKQLGLPCVLTNDTHFCSEDDFSVHLLCVKARKGYTYDSKELFLKSPEQMIRDANERLGDANLVKEMVQNTYNLCSRTRQYEIRSKPKLPVIEDVEYKIISLAHGKLQDLKRRGIINDSIYNDLLESFHKEFIIFKKANLLNYFYIVWDIKQFCNRKNIDSILRGSAVGSVLSYVLGLSDINPLEYGLIFERFYNSSRLDYPDIDTDLPSDKRELVLEYAKRKWNAYPVATNNRYSFNSLIRDVGRVLSIPQNKIENVCEYGEQSKHFEELCNEYPVVKRAVELMIGQVRHQGKHAGGIFISNVDVPFQRLSDGTIATNWDEGPQKNLFSVGVVKFDFLGIDALSQLNEMKETSGDSPPENKFDDPKIFEIFKEGKTTGIFQYGGSTGIREYVKLVKPDSISDLIMTNALYRPGPLDAGTAQKIQHFKKNPQKFHPKIDDILDETYGIICYQEQFMKIFSVVTGFSFNESDIARKIIANAHKMKDNDKEFWSKFNKLKNEFFDNGRKNGFDDGILKTLWEQIETHGRYSFNKSHSTSYALLAYKMAWYKVYYPEYFYASLLNHSEKNIQTVIIEAKKDGLEVISPDINISGNKFVVNGNKIYIPLGSVKYLGKGLDFILKERSENGEFISFEDFASRIPKKVCNKRVKENLFLIGAFDSFNDSPTKILDTSGLEIKTKHETEQEILGFIIPNDVKQLGIDGDRMVGIITDISTRNNGYGSYKVFYLSPDGIFWTDKKPDYNKGDIVDVIVHKGVKLKKGRKIV